MEKVILSASYLIPVSSPPIKDGAVLVEDDRIKDIGPSGIIKTKYPKISTRYFPDSILMPGLVDCHVHLEYSALGHLTKQVAFIPWIKDLIQRQKTLSRKEIVSSIRAAINGLISSGVTTVGEVSRGGLSVSELKKSGLRGIYYNEFVAVDDKRMGKAIYDFEAYLRKSKSKLSKSNFKVGVFPHSVYTLSTKALEYVSSRCEKDEVLCGMHVAESPYEDEFISQGTGPLTEFVKSFQLESIPLSGKWYGTLEYLADLKLLNSLTQLVHCVHLKEKDFVLLEKTKTGIVICPRSNYLLKNGEFPLQTALKYKLKMGLGTDSLAGNYSLDMFEEMRMLKEKWECHSRLRGNDGVEVFLGEKLIKAATLGGAEVLGLEKETGSLTPGKKADLIVVKINKPAKIFSPIDYIISKVSSSDVCFTMIDGVAKHKQA
ncbi:MAG: amidohydrolase family protein [bacterium]